MDFAVYYISGIIGASAKGLEISEIVLFWIVAGMIIAIIVTPILYYRSLRKKKRGQNLRQFLLQDEKLKDALREHYEKKSDPSSL